MLSDVSCSDKVSVALLNEQGPVPVTGFTGQKQQRSTGKRRGRLGSDSNPGLISQVLPKRLRKHLVDQSVFRNVTEFECGAVIGCDCCNKSVCDISTIPQLALGVLIAKPKHLETTETKQHIMQSYSTGSLSAATHHAEESPALCCLNNYSAANHIWH